MGQMILVLAASAAVRLRGRMKPRAEMLWLSYFRFEMDPDVGSSRRLECNGAWAGA